MGSGGTGNREDLCLHLLLLTGVGGQLCVRAHLHTESRRKGSERHSGGLVGGGGWEK